MKFREGLARWIPPVAADRIRNRNRHNVFGSYEQALASCETSYHDVELAEVVVAKTYAFQESIESDATIDLSSLRPLLALAGAQGPSGDPLRVIDFGGGAGQHYLLVRRALPRSQAIDWRVVETPTMATAARKLETSELKFFGSLDAALGHAQTPINLVLASGVLHCVPDPLSALSDLVELGAEWIFITRTAISHEQTTASVVQNSTLSSNGPGALPRGFKDRVVKYPATFVPKDDFENVLASRYRFVFKVVEDRGVYRAGKLPIHMWGYLCQRRGV